MHDDDLKTLTEMPVFPRTPGSPWPGLRVDGMVGTPVTLTATDLWSLPVKEVVQDFSCEEGWVAVGQRWQGVPVATLLDLSEVDSRTRFVRFSAGDFTVALPVEEAMAPETMLAVRLQGRPLAPEHGGPCRLVASGKECFYSVKWVDRVTALAEPPEESGREIALGRIGRVIDPDQ